MRAFAGQHGRVHHLGASGAAPLRLYRTVCFAAFGLGAAGPANPAWGGTALGLAAPGWVGLAAGGLCIAFGLWAGLALARAAVVAGALLLLFLLVFITAPLTLRAASLPPANGRATNQRRIPLAAPARGSPRPAPQAGEWA